MKNGKLFQKLSVIDLAVILLLLMVLVVAAVRLGLFASPEKAPQQASPVSYETVKCSVQLEFQNLPANLQKNPFTEGEVIYEGSKKLGTIEKIDIVPAQATVELTDGSAVTLERKDAYNYIITVQTTLTAKDGMLRAATGNPVAVGQQLSFSTRYYYGKAFVIGVEKTQ